MISTIRRLFYFQPVSQTSQHTNTSVNKSVASTLLTEEKTQQLYNQYVEEIMREKGVTRNVAEAEVNTLG